MVNRRSGMWAMALAAAVLTGGCGAGKPEEGPAVGTGIDVEGLETKTVDLGDGVSLELIRLPAGWVRIGSPKTELDRDDWEGPARAVHFEKGFWIGKYEVTQAQYRQVTGNNPSRFEGDEHPVEWRDDASLVADAAAFLATLSRKTGLPARLPTEAEWEYACRAPAEKDRADATPPELPAYCYGNSHLGLRGFGWADEAGGRTHPVGTLAANRFGLYDVHGNVAELCSDTFENYPDGEARNVHFGKGYPVTRGGSWLSRRSDCRCAARTFFLPAMVAPGSVGLRVVVPIE